jgi:hypothetical protein
MLDSLSIFTTRREWWAAALLFSLFFAFWWLLRGAVPGKSVREEDGDAPPASLVDRLTASIAAGMALVVGGGLVALSRGVAWSIPVFAVGVGLVTGLSHVGRRYRHASVTLRRSVGISSLFLNSALLAGILIVVNVVAFRYGGQAFDLTHDRTHSLSPLTLKQLESLNRPVTFHLVFGRGARAARQLDRIVQLLDLYRASRPDRVRVSSLDPFTELTRRDELMKRAPELAVLRGGAVLIEYGEGADAEFLVVPGPEMFLPVTPESSRQSLDRFETVFKGEDAITSALIRLREGRKSRVAFTIGHDEPSASDMNPSSQGIGIWRSRLASVGCEAIDLNLLKDPIPDDLSLLIIAGPRLPFNSDEVAKLSAYVARGGPVLALVGNREETGLEEFLKGFNLEVGRGIVIDPRFNFNRNPELVFAFLKGGQAHPVRDALQSDRAVLIPSGAPIHILGQALPGQPPTPPVNDSLVPVQVLRTGPESWAETDLNNPRPTLDKGQDEAGPVTVAVAVQERNAEAPSGRGGGTPQGAPKPRLVLISSRSFADNLVQGIEPTNLDFLMNAVSWLRGRPDTVGISPSTHVALTLTADPILRRNLVFVPTILAVLSILGAGLIVYFARRE